MKRIFLNAAKQARGIEKETHPNCLSCAEIIHHPLCAHCIGKGFIEWAHQFTKHKKTLCDNVKRFLLRHRAFDGAGVRCISCNKKRASLCPHCFTNQLHKYVKEAGLGIRATTEFLFIFNFDFNHEGYWAELEFLGGY